MREIFTFHSRPCIWQCSGWNDFTSLTSFVLHKTVILQTLTTVYDTQKKEVRNASIFENCWQIQQTLNFFHRKYCCSHTLISFTLALYSLKISNHQSKWIFKLQNAKCKIGKQTRCHFCRTRAKNAFFLRGNLTQIFKKLYF